MDGTSVRKTQPLAARAAPAGFDVDREALGRRLLVLFFLAFLVYVPVVHVLRDLIDRRVPRVIAHCEIPIDAECLRRYESSLAETSPLVVSLQQRAQALLTCLARRGNANVIVGRDGWLFYRPAIEHVIGRGFLSQSVGAAANNRGGPVAVVLDFRDQLAAQDIELILVPVPGKPTVYPERLAAGFPAGEGPPVNRDLRRFVTLLEEQGLTVIDPTSLLWNAKATSSEVLYLPHDTHWSPAGMRLVAQMLADRLRDRVGNAPPSLCNGVITRASLVQRGDLCQLLGMPDESHAFPLVPISIERVEDRRTGRPNTPDRSSPILLIGDSFTLIFARRDADRHDAAGLGDRLAFELGTRIDVLARDGGDPNYIRRRLAEQPERLNGKRVVVWQFAQRWLTTIEWERVQLAE